jgi:hypothetical protein
MSRLLNTEQQKKTQAGIHLLHLVRFRKVHISGHLPVVSLCPAAMPPSGAMIVFPNRVKENSTLIAFDLVTRLAINPVNSRLRRVLVSIRWRPFRGGGATAHLDKVCPSAKTEPWASTCR